MVMADIDTDSSDTQDTSNNSDENISTEIVVDEINNDEENQIIIDENDKTLLELDFD
jgi:hypothetical protein